MTLVVDASVACKWYFDEPGSEQARGLIGRDGLVAPDLIVAEVANVCWQRVKRKEMTAGDGAIVVAELPDTLDEIFPLAPMAARALDMSAILNHPVYDCFYVALAESLGTVMVSADSRLMRTVAMSSWRNLVRPL